MGMSSSQARLLSLTARQHNVEYKAQKLQAEKLQMANDSDRVYNTYLTALNATKIQARVSDKWEGDTFRDATLAMLEHGVLNNPDETVASNTLFLQDTSSGSNCILVTRDVANKYSITESTTPYIGSMDDYFRDVCGLTEDHRKVVSRYTTITGQDPIPDSVGSFRAIENTINSTFNRTSNVAGAVANSTDATDTTVYDDFKNTITSQDTSGIQDINNVSNLASGQTYKITNAAGLQKLQSLSNTSGVTIILAKDIDASSISGWAGINNFAGTFDGNGHKISNLSGTQGLFSTITSTGNVKNLGMENVNISSTNDRIGGLVGYLNGTVDNCYVTGSIAGNWCTGGIAGEVKDGSVKNSNTKVNITSSDTCVGGISGHNSGTVSGCNATGNIVGSNKVGGLVGHNSGTTVIEDSKTTATVSTTATSNSSIDVGTVIGHGDKGSLTINNISYKPDGTHNICGSKDDSSWNAGIFKATVAVPEINTTDYTGDFYQNILAAMVKSGTVDISNDTEYANLQNNVKSYVQNLYNTGSDADLLNIANINDRIYDYIKNGSTYTTDEKTSFITALQNDINAGRASETTDSAFQTTYTADKYIPSLGTNTGYNAVSENKGLITIPSKDTIIANIQTAFKKDDALEGDIAKVKDYIDSFGTTKQEDLAKLAYINEIITEYAKNGRHSDYSNLRNAIIGDGSNNSFLAGKLPSGVDSLDHYTFKQNSFNQSPTITSTKTKNHEVEVEIKDWDYSLKEVQDALQKYLLQKTGITIIEDEQAYSTDWLTNMINEGRAQFAYFDINSGLTKNADGVTTVDQEKMQIIGTSVATETSLQEVANTENVKKAEATYEKDMKKINKKETKIDTELQQCEAERSSIKTEQDSLKSVIKDNVDLTFKLFS